MKVHSWRYLLRGLSVVLVLFSSYVGAGQSLAPAASLAEQAYYQLEANVFDGTQIQAALVKLGAARKKRADDPWVYMAASLATLIEGYNIGDWYSLKSFEDGTADRAIALAVQARELDPNNSQSHAHFARLLILKGDHKKAWGILNEAYRLNPKSFYPWYFKGIIAENMKDAVRARTYFDEAERRVSQDYQVRLINTHRQAVAEFSREYDEQEHLLKENIRLSPGASYTYGNYAHFLMDHKRYEEAVQYWEKAIAVGSYPEAVKQLALARKLRKSVGHEIQGL